MSDRRARADRVARIVLATALVATAVSGCAVSPAEQRAIRDAWGARDAERAAECRQHNVGFAAGGCVAGGP